MRHLLRVLMVRERYEPAEVAAEGGTSGPTSRLAAIDEERRANEVRLLELRVRRLRRNSEPWRTELEAARDNIERVREEQKSLEREQEAAYTRWVTAQQNLNRYEDRIRALGRGWHQLQGEG